MKVKLDENLGRSALGIVRSVGLDADGVADEGLCGTPDRELLAACQKESRCLVTLDLDFANPIAFPPSGTHGIVVLRPSGADRRESLGKALRAAAEHLHKRDPRGKLWIVQPDRVREYDPSQQEES